MFCGWYISAHNSEELSRIRVKQIKLNPMHHGEYCKECGLTGKKPLYGGSLIHEEQSYCTWRGKSRGNSCGNFIPPDCHSAQFDNFCKNHVDIVGFWE